MLLSEPPFFVIFCPRLNITFITTHIHGEISLTFIYVCGEWSAFEHVKITTDASCICMMLQSSHFLLDIGADSQLRPEATKLVSLFL